MATGDAGAKRGANLQFSRNLALSLALGIFFLIGVVCAVAYWVSSEHSELARTAARKLVAAEVTALEDELEGRVVDYSIWTEAVDAIATGDRGWLYDNIGIASAEIGAVNLDLIVLVDKVRGIEYGWVSGSPADGEPGLIPKAQLKTVLALLADGGDSSSAFVTIDGTVWLLSVTRVVPSDGEIDGKADAGVARQIHGLAFTEDLLARIGERALVEELRLTAAGSGDPFAVPLRGIDGAAIADVVWLPPAPGARILRQIAVPLGIALGLVALLGIISSRYAVRSARRLESALAAAKAADRSKTEFLANVSHELRTPMNGIIGVLDLLNTTDLDEEQELFVTTMSNSAEAHMALIHELLEVSQLETGERTLMLRPFEPAKVMDEVINLARFSADEKGLDVQLDHGSLQGLTVVGDGSAFRQILTNLVGNAIKFTDEGRVTVSASTAIRNDELHCQIAVTDTGIGIDKSDHERIFERFSQADYSTTREYGGTGLGLAICKSLADLVGATIAVDSALGHGSTFTLTINFEMAAAEDAKAEHAA